MRQQIVLLLVSLCVLCGSSVSAAKPNIVYVRADQWRASATSYAGDPNVKTPNLDRLARESLNFRNAVSVLPVCTPHRAALMTGRYPTSTGMFLNDVHLPDSELCMAEILGAAGNATAYTGKWHLDGHGREYYVPRTVATPITTPDILPTLLGLAGVSKPKTIEGEDLSPLLRTGRDEDRAALYMCVSPFANVPREKLSEYRAIRTSRYTYVRGLDGPWVLYDDQADRFQTNNLVGNAEFASLVRELDGRLQAQLKRIGDDFRPGKDYLAEWGYEIGPHGSVPYAPGITKVQTPRRNPAAKPGLQKPKSAAEKPAATNGVPQK